MTSFYFRHNNIGLLRFLVRFVPDSRFVELGHSCVEPFPAISVLLAPIMAEILRVRYLHFLIFLVSVKTTETDKFVKR